MINVLLQNRRSVRLHQGFFRESGDRLLFLAPLILERNLLLQKEQDQYYRDGQQFLFQSLLNACDFDRT